MRNVFTCRRAPSIAVAISAAAALAACSGDSGESQPGEPERGPGQDVNIVQPGAPGEPSRTLSREEAEEIESPPHTQADVDFMQGMIHHHAQALVMTSLVRDRSASKNLRTLARRIELAQEAEIETMGRWLTARDEEPPDAGDHEHDHGGGENLMPGMLSDEELANLAAADGRRFDRMFLEFMIRHHRGALTMVGQLRAKDGGVEPEIDLFARHVESDQDIEINRMAGLLAQVDRLR
jgi:uncharacterized protein (DUF305 family)